jgi:hypothetical protein
MLAAYCPVVMAGYVPATSRARLSLRVAGTCPAMTIGGVGASRFSLQITHMNTDQGGPRPKHSDPILCAPVPIRS